MLNKFQIRFSGVASSHCFQNAGTAALSRQVNLIADVLSFQDQMQHLQNTQASTVLSFRNSSSQAALIGFCADVNWHRKSFDQIETPTYLIRKIFWMRRSESYSHLTIHHGNLVQQSAESLSSFLALVDSREATTHVCQLLCVVSPKHLTLWQIPVTVYILTQQCYFFYSLQNLRTSC